VGGAAALLTHLPVDELLSSLEEGHALHDLATRSTRCEAGQSWTWAGVRFELLHPRSGDYGRMLKSNAMSCVLKVSAAQGRVLLAGDIERQQEGELAVTQREALRSDVLLVPHHGSRTSSTAAFLDAVAPRVAVVQAGYRNRFGHPAPDVVARLRERGVAVLTSADCGAWRWVGEARGGGHGLISGSCERDLSRRYWHRAGPRG
jgi:competence protein ComEC